MQKKGSLSLSINAVVIIVLAMTLLGLGLAFIRGLFKDITETTGTVQEQVKQQILEDLKTGDKKLSFSTNQLNIPLKESEIVSVGVKNSKSGGSLNFIIQVTTTQLKEPSGVKYACTERDTDASSPTFGQCTTTSPEGGEVKINTGIDFFYDKGPFTLVLDDAEVYPITISASGFKGTYLVKLSILEDTDADGIYGEVDAASGTNEAYAEKTFFINVV